MLVAAGIGGGRQCDRCAQVAVGKDAHRAADRVAIDHTGQRRRANAGERAVSAAAGGHAVRQGFLADGQCAGCIGDGVVAGTETAAADGNARCDTEQAHSQVTTGAMRAGGGPSRTDGDRVDLFAVDDTGACRYCAGSGRRVGDREGSLCAANGEGIAINLAAIAGRDRNRPRRHRAAASRYRQIIVRCQSAITSHVGGGCQICRDSSAAHIFQRKRAASRCIGNSKAFASNQAKERIPDTGQTDAGAAVINLARRAVEAGGQGFRTDGQRAEAAVAAANSGVYAVIGGICSGQADNRLLVAAGIGGSRQRHRTGQLGGGKDTHRAADRIAIDHTGQRRRANTCRSAVAAAAVCHAVGQCQRVDRQRAGGVGDGVVARQCAAAGNGVAGADRVQTHAEVAICAVRRIGRSG